MQFNTEVLARPLSPPEIESIKAKARQGGYGPVPSLGGALVVVGVALALFVAVPTLVFAVGAIIVNPAYARAVWVLAVPTLLFSAGMIAILLVAVRGRQDHRWVRLAAFADANGLQYRLRSTNPYYPGMLFGVARQSAVTEHIFSNTGTFADAGRYSYQVNSGENTTTYVWNYVAFRLPRPMPHIVLDALANNTALGSNLPIAFDGGQVVKLGDPFDQRYRLYAPGDYQLDAFYMFPPDLMEMLMRTPVVLDIEIIDAWMFCYTRQELDFTNPRTWQILGHIDDTIVARMGRIDRRYTDSRVARYQPAAAAVRAGRPTPQIGPGQPVRRMWVAPPGQRLRHSSRGLWIALVVLLAVGALMVIPVFVQMLLTMRSYP